MPRCDHQAGEIPAIDRDAHEGAPVSVRAPRGQHIGHRGRTDQSAGIVPSSDPALPFKSVFCMSPSVRRIEAEEVITRQRVLASTIVQVPGMVFCMTIGRCSNECSAEIGKA